MQRRVRRCVRRCKRECLFAQHSTLAWFAPRSQSNGVARNCGVVCNGVQWELCLPALRRMQQQALTYAVAQLQTALSYATVRKRASNPTKQCMFERSKTRDRDGARELMSRGTGVAPAARASVGCGRTSHTVHCEAAVRVMREEH